MSVSLILGGARSGKSSRAETLGLAVPATDHVYVATAQALADAEMAGRIARHRGERDRRWRTVEEPLDLAAILGREAGPDRVVLVDCLTLWLTNVMLAGRDPSAATDDLTAILGSVRGDVVLVSNEVGLGLVPDTALGRAFRDAQGRLNQAVAAQADHVEFMVAGLPMVMKGQSARTDRI